MPERTVNPDLTGVERILLVAAHPDDIDFAAAGSVAAWTAAGIHVAYCIVTSGEAGGHDRTMSRSTMAELRQHEQTAAAATVGVTEIHWLGHPDCRVEANLDLRHHISRVIRQVRPQRVVCQSAERNMARIYASHPDHLAAGEATISAVYPDARSPFAHPELLDEGLEPWTVDEVYVMQVAGPADLAFDITDTYDRKVAALRCHASQLPDPEDVFTIVRAWATANAADFDLPPDRLAECFARIDTR